MPAIYCLGGGFLQERRCRRLGCGGCGNGARGGGVWATVVLLDPTVVEIMLDMVVAMVVVVDLGGGVGCGLRAMSRSQLHNLMWVFGCVFSCWWMGAVVVVGNGEMLLAIHLSRSWWIWYDNVVVFLCDVLFCLKW